MSDTVVAFKKVESPEIAIAEMCEQYAKDLREGKVVARTAILVWRDGEGESIGYKAEGVVTGASQLMGILTFAQHFIYDQTQYENG